MNSYFFLKTLHILSSVFLVGTGFGSAFYLFMLNRSNNLQVMRAINRSVVLADYLFTIPTLILQPLTGYGLMKMMNIGFNVFWIKWALILYLVAGICWIPAYFLQIKICKIAQEAKSFEELPNSYKLYLNCWAALGIPSFLCMAAIYYLMITKP